jgi:hypothetical protein
LCTLLLLLLLLLLLQALLLHSHMVFGLACCTV